MSRYIYDLSYIGKTIKSWRVENNYSVDLLAEKLDISPNYLRLVEQGNRALKMRRLISFCNISGCSMDDLCVMEESRSMIGERCSDVENMLLYLSDYKLNLAREVITHISMSRDNDESLAEFYKSLSNMIAFFTNRKRSGTDCDKIDDQR